MMRAHGIAPNAATIKPPPTRTPKSERRDSSGSANKKRKADQYLEDTPADDDEGYGPGHIVLVKDDPADVKEEFVVKDEAEPQQQGQMHLEQAANLLQYYDDGSQYGASQLGGNDVYGASEYGGGLSGYGTSSGFGTPISTPFGLPTANHYYNTPYGTVGMNDIPRSQQVGFYQPALQYQTDDQGRSESPVIVE
jgi:hypothetical protein